MTSYAGQYGPESYFYPNGRPAKNVPVTIYERDTLTLVTLYTSRTKLTTAANPTACDSLGNLTFYAEPNVYDLLANGATLPILVYPDPDEPVSEPGLW